MNVTQAAPAKSISMYESPRKLAQSFVAEFSQKAKGSGAHQIELRYVVPQSDTFKVREAVQQELEASSAIRRFHNVAMHDQPAVNGFGWNHTVITVTAEV